jgi:topoisomerase-4 subunit A
MSKTESTNIHNVDFQEALSERYLAYALSTIMSRSLPDVRDGLKPVHRRLIYAMQQLKLNPNSGFKKCARVVGDVMGKFHPHGDAAIYGALVRLAQDFSVRYPLIEGQGNFGNIDGDGAAAMRYTEARLSEVALSLMEGLEENAVDFRATYDGESEEPIVFPSAFPNLLANGATGIAVGMATSIPPHNLDEICQALMHLIDNPLATIDELLNHLPAPDFPTGGVLVENREALLKAYETGRGSFRLRAAWQVEEQKGGTYRIVVTHIPYQVEKSKLIEKIAALLNDKRLPLLDDVLDESTDEIRLVLQPKSRNIDASLLMESLFRLTDLETRIPLNMNVLDGHNIPRVMSLKEVLQSFLNHRMVVQHRRTTHRLDQIVARLEILSGYLIAYLNLDEVIRIIRDEDEPKDVMKEKFGLTDNQVEAILNMRLRSLRKLQEIEIRKEHDNLEKEQKALKRLLESEKLQWQKIRSELEGLCKKFGKNTVIGKRRTLLAAAPEPVDFTELETVEKEDVTIVLSAKNWIRAIKGHQTQDLKYKEGDEERFVITGQTTDKILLFATNGRFYTIGADKLPRTRGHGEPLRLLIDLENTEDILNIFVVTPAQSDMQFLLTSSEGRGFIINAKDALAQTKAGKQILVLNDNEKARGCLVVTGDQIAVIGENRKLLVFPVKDIPTMTRGKGVAIQKYRDGKMSDITIFSSEQGLSWIKAGKAYTEKDLRTWQGKRAGAGRLAPIGFPRTNKFE